MPKKKKSGKKISKKRRVKRIVKHPKVIKEEPKKVHKKRSIRRIVRYPRIPNEESEIGKTLIENFVSLQRIMLNLSNRFDNLSEQISKLLGLFEISAKVLAEKDFEIERGNTQENLKILEKIDSIIDQNKTIARGLSLMHEKTSPQSNYSSASTDYPSTPTNYSSAQPNYSSPKINSPPTKPNYPPTQSIDSEIPRLPSKLPVKSVPRATIPQGDDGEYHKSITSGQPNNIQ